MILPYGMGGRCIRLKRECGWCESRQAHSSSRDDRHATAPKTLAMVKMTCVYQIKYYSLSAKAWPQQAADCVDLGHSLSWHLRAKHLQKQKVTLSCAGEALMRDWTHP